MRVGHKAQSLPLWDEFAMPYQRHNAALVGLVATADVAEHLAEIATLCSQSSPALSSCFTNLATLDSASLPGVSAPQNIHIAHAACTLCLQTVGIRV